MVSLRGTVRIANVSIRPGRFTSSDEVCTLAVSADALELYRWHAATIGGHIDMPRMLVFAT
jgi:hypothetical protein